LILRFTIPLPHSLHRKSAGAKKAFIDALNAAVRKTIIQTARYRVEWTFHADFYDDWGAPRYHAPDLDNLAKVGNDALAKRLGINDRWFRAMVIDDRQHTGQPFAEVSLTMIG
jgi:Holliday junction resolvase RusA-like endonuclease